MPSHCPTEEIPGNGGGRNENWNSQGDNQSCLSLTCPGERSCLSCAGSSVWEHIPISLQPNSFPTWPELCGPHPALQTPSQSERTAAAFPWQIQPQLQNSPVTESDTRRKSRLGFVLTSQIQRKSRIWPPGKSVRAGGKIRSQVGKIK